MGPRQIGLRDVEETRTPRRLRLLAPLRYLLIEAPEKRFYDRVLPIVFAVGTFTAYNWLSPRPGFFGERGILAVAQDFLILAVPFLIGALAAVAMGSPGTHLDKRAVGAGLILEGRNLTLRQFVSFLLGYLCFLGLVSFLLVSGLIFAQDAIVSIDLTTAWLKLVAQIGIFSIFLLFSAFVVTVFWSLYFLTDVVNRTE